MTRYRALAPLVLLGVVLSTTGCLQWGEYAMGGECADLSRQIRAIVTDAYRTEVSIDDMWAGEAEVWCSFDIVTDMDLPENDELRREVADRVLEAVNDFSTVGVEVTIRYDAGADTLSAAPPACAAAADDIQRRLAAHYGLHSPLAVQWGLPGTLQCRFSITIDRNLPFAADERAEARTLVRASLPQDVEVNIVYPDSRDTIVIDSRGN